MLLILGNIDLQSREYILDICEEIRAHLIQLILIGDHFGELLHVVPVTRTIGIFDLILDELDLLLSCGIIEDCITTGLPKQLLCSNQCKHNLSQ